MAVQTIHTAHGARPTFNLTRGCDRKVTDAAVLRHMSFFSQSVEPVLGHYGRATDAPKCAPPVSGPQLRAHTAAHRALPARAQLCAPSDCVTVCAHARRAPRCGPTLSFPWGPFRILPHLHHHPATIGNSCAAIVFATAACAGVRCLPRDTRLGATHIAVGNVRAPAHTSHTTYRTPAPQHAATRVFPTAACAQRFLTRGAPGLPGADSRSRRTDLYHTTRCPSHL